MSCTVNEWDTKWRDIDTRRLKIERETEAATEALGNMILDGTDGVGEDDKEGKAVNGAE